MGYVGNHARRNPHEPVERDTGTRALNKVRAYRNIEGLGLPYGPAATALGLPSLAPTLWHHDPPPP